MKAACSRPASRYVRCTAARQEASFLRGFSRVLLFVMFVLPQYFGIPLPLFDLTALRVALLLGAGIVLLDKDRLAAFWETTRQTPCWLPLLVYLFVLLYTMVFRRDVNALLNPVMEFLALYLLVYLIRAVLGLGRAIRCLVAFSYLLAVLGVAEFLLGRSPFSWLATIDGLYTGQFIRSGMVRIMGPANHSLGYGLMLVCMLPLAVLDLERDRIDLLRHFPLVALIAANVLFCGSRSTLGVFLLECALLFLFSPRENQKRLLLLGGALGVLLAGVLFFARGSALARSILLPVATLADELLGTGLSAAWGANEEALAYSSDYRAQLIYIFRLEWLNPLLGIGRRRSLSAEINGVYINSVDNFYIAEFVRYAWPGLAAYALYAGSFLACMLRDSVKSASGLTRALFIGAGCYFLNLLWLDSLQTLKYVYLLFALYAVARMERRESPAPVPCSKYLTGHSFLGKRQWRV